MGIEYEIKGDWQTKDGGQVYTVRAVTETGRIAGRVVAHMNLDTQIALQETLGQMGIEAVESSAADLLKTMLEARHGE